MFRNGHGHLIPNLAWWDIIKWPAVSMDDYQAVLNKSTKAESACFSVCQPKQIKYKKNLASDVYNMGSHT